MNRRFIANLQPGKLFLKIDFKNAFNTVRRDIILEAVAGYFPELLTFATSTLSDPSDLMFSDFHFSSEEGAQQGDPLGPLYFCLAIKPLLDTIESELHFGYLDDLTIGGDAETVADDFERIESSAAILGLRLNRSKCEIVGHTEQSREIFASRGISLPETNRTSVMLLGSPLSDGQIIDDTISIKCQEFKLISARLALMPSHDSLYLLRHVIAMPRLLYTLRTAPCMNSQNF